MMHPWNPALRSAAAIACLCAVSGPLGAAVLPENAPGEIAALREGVDHALHWIATGIEVAGVAIIVVGALIASALFLRQGFAVGWGRAFRGYRANLGRGILLGLELLVGADIVATVTAPLTWESVGLLGLIVLIRTFLSFSLETEIEGVWPWRRRVAGRADTR